MNGEEPRESAARINSWWAAILAGQVDEPHPIHGADLDVAFKRGTLYLSGELVSEGDRDKVVGEASSYVGKGIDEVDAKHLIVTKTKEKRGILDQTLIAAFADRDVAEFARAHLIDNRRVKPKLVEILDASDDARIRALLPEPFVADARKAFRAGDAVLILRVDEISAYRVRELLAQETRSLWTVAMPPVPSTGPGR